MPRKPNARDYADMRMRNKFPVTYPKEKALLARERLAFLHISHYLHFSGIALAKERYITAMYGCQTTWPTIEEMSIYFNVEHKT
jgi:hypothetical protein